MQGLSVIDTIKVAQGGADVDAQTLEGWTALHLASKDCRLHIVQQLLKAGADSSLQVCPLLPCL